VPGRKDHDDVHHCGWIPLFFVIPTNELPPTASQVVRHHNYH